MILTLFNAFRPLRGETRARPPSARGDDGLRSTPRELSNAFAVALLCALALGCGPSQGEDDVGEGTAGTENPGTSDTGRSEPLSCDEITDPETCNSPMQDGEARDCRWFPATRVQLNEDACAREETAGFCSNTWTGDDGCPVWDTCADFRTVFYRYEDGALWLTKMSSCDVPSGWDGACGYGNEPDECACACEDYIFD